MAKNIFNNSQVICSILVGFAIGAVIASITCLSLHETPSTDTCPTDTISCDDSVLSVLLEEEQEEERYFASIKEDLFRSICEVESGNNPKAHNPKHDAAGIMQITPIMLREVNNIRHRHGEQPFALSDRYDPAKSQHMFETFMDTHNPFYEIDEAFRLWNPKGGNDYIERCKNIYYELRKERSLYD